MSVARYQACALADDNDRFLLLSFIFFQWKSISHSRYVQRGFWLLIDILSLSLPLSLSLSFLLVSHSWPSWSKMAVLIVSDEPQGASFETVYDLNRNNKTNWHLTNKTRFILKQINKIITKISRYWRSQVQVLRSPDFSEDMSPQKCSMEDGTISRISYAFSLRRGRRQPATSEVKALQF
jgi:hypothetical protein